MGTQGSRNATMGRAARHSARYGMVPGRAGESAEETHQAGDPKSTGVCTRVRAEAQHARTVQLPHGQKADGSGHERWRQIAAVFGGEIWLLAVFGCFAVS